MSRNFGGIVSRGFGEFSRVLTRGLGRFIRRQTFFKEKGPIIRDFSLEIYVPIKKTIENEFVLKISFIKKLFKQCNVNINLKKFFKQNPVIYNKVDKTFSYEYQLGAKMNNKRLINTLNFLIEDD